jgi:hypothetical protein
MSARNVAYVREKRIAALLNDMVVHLLASQPTDTVGSLIGYLERRLGDEQRGADRKQAADAVTLSPTPPAQQKTKESSRPQRQPGTDADSAGATNATAPAPEVQATAEATPKADATQAAPPAEQTTERASQVPPPAAQPAPIVAESASPDASIEGDAMSPTVSKVQNLVTELAGVENELGEMLRQVLADATLPNALRRDVEAAAGLNAEIVSLTGAVRGRYSQVGSALTRVKRAMSASEYAAASGFQLIHALENNERQFLDSVDVAALSLEDLDAVTEAKLAHCDMRSLLAMLESRHVELSALANRGDARAVCRLAGAATAEVVEGTAEVSHALTELLAGASAAEAKEVLETQQQLEALVIEAARVQHAIQRQANKPPSYAAGAL